jgi:hypothetical protein
LRQVPFVPHVAASSVAQRLSAVPLMTGAQKPGKKGELQVWHAPVQAELQHTPCAQ